MPVRSYDDAVRAVVDEKSLREGLGPDPDLEDDQSQASIEDYRDEEAGDNVSGKLDEPHRDPADGPLLAEAPDVRVESVVEVRDRPVDHLYFVVQFGYRGFRWNVVLSRHTLRDLHLRLVGYRLVHKARGVRLRRLLVQPRQYDAQERAAAADDAVWATLPSMLTLYVTKDTQAASAMVQTYLRGVLRMPSLRECPDLLAVLEVSRATFDRRLGLSLKESWMRVRFSAQTAKKHHKTQCCCGSASFCCCVCFCFRKRFSLRSRQRLWAALKPTALLFFASPQQATPVEVVLLDENFVVHKQLTATGIQNGLLIENSAWLIELALEGSEEQRAWSAAVEHAVAESAWCEHHANGSYSVSRHPTQTLSSAEWFVDGHDTWNAVFDAIESAQHTIFIAGWWVWPTVYLRRPPARDAIASRLDRLLERRAQAGVQVFILMYKEIEAAVKLSSRWAMEQFSLLNTDNVFVMRHSNRWHALYWSHHEKIVAIDQRVAFVGGLDLCYGRYDTAEHRLDDSRAPETWPGKDYSNPRVRDFCELDKDGDLIDRETVPRMPWHDVHCVVYGQPAIDVSRHFIHRWNWTRKVLRGGGYRRGRFGRPGQHYGVPPLLPHDDLRIGDSGDTSVASHMLSRLGRRNKAAEGARVVSPDAERLAAKVGAAAHRAEAAGRRGKEKFMRAVRRVRRGLDRSASVRDHEDVGVSSSDAPPASSSSDDDDSDDSSTDGDVACVEDLDIELPPLPASLSTLHEASWSAEAAGAPPGTKPRFAGLEPVSEGGSSGAETETETETEPEPEPEPESKSDDEGEKTEEGEQTVAPPPTLHRRGTSEGGFADVESDDSERKPRRSLADIQQQEEEKKQEIVTVDDSGGTSRRSVFRARSRRRPKPLMAPALSRSMEPEDDNVPPTPVYRYHRPGDPFADALRLQSAPRPEEPAPALHAGIPCRVQIVRSLSAWSGGLSDTERSIAAAYYALIENAERFVYIENQFFVSAMHGDTDVGNRVVDVLFRRVLNAFHNGEAFKVVIVMPLLPAFEGDEFGGKTSSASAVMYWQYRTLSRGGRSLMERLADHGINPNDFVLVCGLRTHDRVGSKGHLVSEQIYIHSKVLIVDDRHCIIGSANINDRSLLGSRDSEIASVISDTDTFRTRSGAVVGRFCHSLRMRLFHEHLGLAPDSPRGREAADPTAPTFWAWMRRTALHNSTIYRLHFGCIPCDSIKNMADLERAQRAMEQREGAAATATARSPSAKGVPVPVPAGVVSPGTKQRLLRTSSFRITTDANAALDDVQGSLVTFPLNFLTDVNLLPSLLPAALSN